MLTDLRSDTFTKPSPEMLDFMAKAPVGDDVFSEDPTVNELEAFGAAYFGMEAGIFCPSGTMTNQVAIKCHTQPGEEVICEKTSHIYQYEGGGIAFNSGCQVKLLEAPRGLLTAAVVAESVNNKEDVHKPISRLVSLENTSNRGGGSCYDFSVFPAIKAVCLDHDMKLHLDGARLWNAMVAKNEDPLAYGKVFDSISICLSKGLGAPVGSLLLGSREYIKRARRIRKVLGGGMRQAGYLAAAGLYAIKNNLPMLKIDHSHAQMIANALAKKEWIKVLPVETNIIIFEVGGPFTASSFVAEMKKNGILCMSISPGQVRMVTHLDVTPSMVEQTIQVINAL